MVNSDVGREEAHKPAAFLRPCFRCFTGGVVTGAVGDVVWDVARSSDGPGTVLSESGAVLSGRDSTNPALDMAADTRLPRFRVLGGSGWGGDSATSAFARLARFLDGWAEAAAVGLASAAATFRLREGGAGGGMAASVGAVEVARLSLAEERVTLGDMRKWSEGLDYVVRETVQSGRLRSKKQGRS
jgi:hypothetical protein